MKSRLKSLIYTVLCVLIFSTNTIPVDTNQLALWAETQGLGYKTANLMQLNQLTKDLNGKLPADYRVQVPQFYGIAAQQIDKVLYKQEVDLKREWETILKTVTPEMHRTHVVTPEFVKASEILAQKIEDGFNKAAYTIKNQEISLFLKPRDICLVTLKSVGFDEEEASSIEAFIIDVAMAKGLITLRSTGLREDTDKVANAGGNKSCEIVRATLAEAVKNMGTVAASYLKEKSLMQRSGKDEKIFEEPKLPVLLQLVVGEHQGNPVVSCVAYSQERQGNTKGVSSLQCNHGHGKSVVDSIFPFDTYYIDDATKTSFSIIRIKTKRMTPHLATAYELVAKDNDPAIQTQSALEPCAQQAIQILMMELEKAYSRPMDVELVVDQTKKIIYLVQARPIVYETQKIQPRYVSEIVTFNPTKTVSVQKIYVNGAVYLLKPDEILVTSNLESALKLVLGTEATQEKDPQVIIVAEPGAITSHAGATLAGKGIVLLQIDNQKPLNDLLAKKDSLWLVDSQRGLLIDITNDNRFENQQEAQLVNKGLLKEGWYTHPIPPVISVTIDYDHTRLTTALAEYAKRDDAFPTTTISDLITMVKEAPQDQAQTALESIVIRTAKDIEAFEATQPHHAIVNQLHAVFNQMISNTRSIEQTLSLPSRHNKRLFAVNFLEALLHQQPLPSVVHSFSIHSIQSAHNEEIAFIAQKLSHHVIDKSLLKNRSLMVILQQGLRAAPTKESEEQWITLVNQWSILLSAEEITTITAMVSALDELGALPTWIYARVVPEMAKQADIKTVTSLLCKEFAASKTAINKLNDIQKWLQTIDYKLWQDPKKFEHNLKNVHAQLLEYAQSQELLSLLTPHNNHILAHLLGVAVMGTLVEAFDTIIKTVKANTNYTDDVAKAKDFKVLLQNYFELLNSWANAIPEHIMRYQQFDRSLDKYLGNLFKTINDIEPTVAQLLPSAQFDVRAAALGGATNASDPKTLEDCFTTVHQSLEIVLQAFSKDLITLCSLPPLLNKANTILQQLKAQVVGIVVKPETITIFYNLPLNEHSGAFQLTWKKHDKSIELQYSWYGGGTDRWTQIIALATLVSNAYGIPLTNIKLDDELGTMRFTQQFTDENSITTIAPMITHMINMTFYKPAEDFIPYLQTIVPKAIHKDRCNAFKSLVIFEEVNISDFFNDKEERWNLATKTIFDENSEIRKGSLRALNEFTDDSFYAYPLWIITQRALQDREMYDKAFGLLKKYTDKKAYQNMAYTTVKKIVTTEVSKHSTAYSQDKIPGAAEIIALYSNRQEYESEIFGIAEKLIKHHPSEALEIIKLYSDKNGYEDKVFSLIPVIIENSNYNTITLLTMLEKYAHKEAYTDKVFELLQQNIGYRWAYTEDLTKIVSILAVYANKQAYKNRVFALLLNNKNLYSLASDILKGYAQKDDFVAFTIHSFLQNLGIETTYVSITPSPIISYKIPQTGGNFNIILNLPQNNQEALLEFKFYTETSHQLQAIVKLMCLANGIAADDNSDSIKLYVSKTEQLNAIGSIIAMLQHVYGKSMDTNKEAFDFIKDVAKEALKKEQYSTLKELEKLKLDLMDIYDNPEELFATANALNQEGDFYNISHTISNILNAYAQKEGYGKQVFELAKNSYNNWRFDADLRNTAFTIICSYANKEPYQAKAFELIQDIALNDNHETIRLEALEKLIDIYGDLKNYKARVFKIIRKSEAQYFVTYDHQKRNLVERYKTTKFTTAWNNLSMYQKVYRNLVGTSRDEMIEEFLSEQILLD